MPQADNDLGQTRTLKARAHDYSGELPGWCECGAWMDDITDYTSHLLDLGWYVPMTMCHCDEPDECYEHWSVGIPKVRYRPDHGYVAVAGDMTSGFHSRADAQLFADAKNDG